VPNPNAPKSELQPKQPIEVVNDLKVPVLGLYGGLDTGIPLDGVMRMQDELKKGKSGSEIVVFPNAKHGFLADYREGYNKESGEDAWKKLIAWFQENGVK
jgi:carboxymethylenebutenolidase